MQFFSNRVIFLFSLFIIILTSAVSLLVQSLYCKSGAYLPLMFSILLSLFAIAGVGKLLYYQQSLKRIKNNLNEAQQLAGLGSWERDIATGRGYWSDNLYRLFRLPIRSLAPTLEEFFLMIHEEDRLQVRETVMAAISSGNSYEMKYRPAGNADDRIFLNRGKVLLDDAGKPITLVGSIQDVTDKQRSEQFQKGLLKEKELFISRLGHDLKTPLTPLVVFLPQLRSRNTDPTQQKLLDLCVDSVNHINNLVLKTLKLARLSSSADILPLCFDLPLSDTVDSAISSMADTISEYHLTVKNLIPPEMTVKGNREELEELFSQLISNSAKFSLEGSALAIEASSDKRVVTLLFMDNGIGLLPEELEHIFDDFYKADNSRHLLNSSGLGLTICRRIVRNHRGRISASSKGRGYGTTISFTLEAGGAYDRKRIG